MTICSVSECRGKSTHGETITVQTVKSVGVTFVVWLCRDHAKLFPNAAKLDRDQDVK